MPDDVVIRTARRLWPDMDSTNFDLFDFLYAAGSPTQALFYSAMFWPDFVEFEDMVFLATTLEDESDRERVRDALQYYEGDRAVTERSFNTVELPAMFGRREDELSYDEYEFLACRVRSMWEARLRELFPQRRFVVEVLPEDESLDQEISLRFYETR